MKIFKILFLCILVVIAGFTGWHFYMKSTWDHHLVGNIYIYDKQLHVRNLHMGEENKLSKKEFLELAQNYKIPVYDIVLRNVPLKVAKIEIFYEDGQYYWVSNKNKRLTKRLERDGRWDVYIFETENRSEFIKVFSNSFEIGGCNARPYYYMWNIEIQQILDNKIVLLTEGLTSFYQNPLQYFLCYDPVKS